MYVYSYVLVVDSVSVFTVAGCIVYHVEWPRALASSPGGQR